MARYTNKRKADVYAYIKNFPRYINQGKANVYISKGFKTVFYGLRTIYTKDATGRVYVRYKNKYYQAHYDGRHTYNVRIP